MWQLFNSDMEVLVRAGLLYLPLQFDAQVEMEVRDRPGEDFDELLVRRDEQYFIQSLSLDSLVEHYPAAFPEEYEGQRRHFRQGTIPDLLTYQHPVDDRLETILFEILPHFWRRQRGRRGQGQGRAEVLAYLAAKVASESGADVQIKNVRHHEKKLQEAILQLESLEGRPVEPPAGRGPARELAGWFRGEVRRRLVREEIGRRQPELDRVRELLSLPEAELGVLLTVGARGAVEVDGCGCCPDPRYSGEYLMYVRTGEYVLQDYFDRLYLFPDCRVAVSTVGPFRPVVVEKYKHPLLRYMRERQQICLTGYQPEEQFSAAAVIRALEEGLNALFYGYNSRKRNGYNSLDRYGRDLSVVDFEDLRLGKDDVRVVSGELEVKNRYV